MIMAKTAGEIELGAAASNDFSSHAQLRRILNGKHGSTGDASGTTCRCGNIAGTAGRKRGK